jgi:Flp pilus assembly protein TadD
MSRRENWYVGMAIFLVTMVLYWPVVGFPFVNFDDQLYVYQNPNVVHGFSWEGIKWSCTSVVAANWHPLTMVSHMADWSVYGRYAGGHHLTNILLHSSNAVLLWLLLKRMTKCFWPSALVAALFAWHPLNVESVAWIAERKNVLSAFFFILTAWGYMRYVEHPRPAKYALALLLFAAGLAAKPMLVTLPFILLLLDYWPLQRISFSQNRLGWDGRKLGRLLLEKIPFLMVAVADCIITFLAQNHSGSVRTLEEVPLAMRLVNIPIAYLAYLGKAFYPSQLCVFYDFPSHLPVLAGLVSFIILVAMTFLVWHFKSACRWLLVGWLWYLGMLIPVIGLVQTGSQAMADRHTYLPLVGIFFILAYTLNEVLVERRQLRSFVVGGVMIMLLCNLVLTRRQLMQWQSSVALFTQAVAINPECLFSQEMLGTAYHAEGRIAEAIEHYSAAVNFRPTDPDLQYVLGRELIEAGKFSEAENHLAIALRHMPDNPILHNTRGVALLQCGRPQEAELEFSRAITIQSDYSKPYFNLGKTLLAEGRNQLAITNFLAALRFEADWPEALQNLARAYAAAGDQSNAVNTARAALKIAQASQQGILAGQITDELKAYLNASNPQSSSSHISH